LKNIDENKLFSINLCQEFGDGTPKSIVFVALFTKRAFK
jgi:hypothetical protein